MTPADIGAPDFRARSPFGKVPVLEASGLHLTESAAILGWVAETHGALLPADPAGRARAREVVSQAGAYLYPVGVMGLFFQDADVRGRNGGTPDEAAVAAAAGSNGAAARCLRGGLAHALHGRRGLQHRRYPARDHARPMSR